MLIFVCLHGGTWEATFSPHYAPGVMARVAHNRGMEPVACMISSPTLPLGTWVWVYGIKTGALLHCRVTDVSHPRDKQRHLATNRRAELSFEVTKRVCGTTKGASAECPIYIMREH